MELKIKDIRTISKILDAHRVNEIQLKNILYNVKKLGVSRSWITFHFIRLEWEEK